MAVCAFLCVCVCMCVFMFVPLYVRVCMWVGVCVGVGVVGCVPMTSTVLLPLRGTPYESRIKMFH